MKDKLELIRQKCIEANPSIDDSPTYFDRPIRLADVLLAIDHSYKFGLLMTITCVREDGQFWQRLEYGKDFEPTEAHWNLREDDLTKQSEQTITFLYDLLK